jgi:glycosyltransferase involved in cell wall biosynthesis
MKVALVHEWLTNVAGSEACLWNFHELFPEAPIYTSVFNAKTMPQEWQELDIHPSFLQKLNKKRHQVNLPLMPFAFESFDFSGYDCVLTSGHSCAKGVITPSDCVHICYCHTPMRYIWEYRGNYTQGMGRIKKSLIGLLSHYLRLWDLASAARVDYFIANSTAVQKRIQKTYRREAEIIFPPVRCSEFSPSETDGGYYLVLSRMVEYKRLDLAVRACSELGRELVVVGDGVERKRLEKMAGPSVRFLGRLPDAEVKTLMAECRALLFPGEEDFGIVPVEAMACGRPVIAFGRGGALDTVVDGETGVLFGEQTVEALKEAILKFEGMKFKKGRIREHALQFDEGVFRKKILEFVEQKVGGGK